MVGAKGRTAIAATTATLGILAAVLAATATSAAAHAVGGPGPTNFITEITSVSPAMDGVEVRVLGFGDRIEVRNRSGTEVVVLGYEGEAYLRIGPEGVYENRRSPAAYLNADRQADVSVPDEADATAAPRWERVSGGTTARWHDHRVHWMGTGDPAAVQRDPGRSHLLYPRWTVPLRAGETEVEVVGTLRWVPGPSPWPPLAAAVIVALVGAVAALVWRRASLWILAGLVAGLVAVDVWHTVGLAWAPGSPDSPAARLLQGSIGPALAWTAGVLALVGLLGRRPASGRLAGGYLAALSAAVVLLVGGVGDLGALSRSQVAFAGGAGAARIAVAGSIAAALGALLVAAIVVTRLQAGQPDGSRRQAA